MRRLFVIPLVGVMLAALAVPVLAEEGDSYKETLTDQATGKGISVYGTRVAKSTSSSTVYSVDIEWGSMKFDYSTNTTKTWDPETHSFSDNGNTSSWKPAVRGDDVELESNIIKITNHSNASIKCNLRFEPSYWLTESYNPEGTFDKPTFSLESGVDKTYDSADKNTAALSIKTSVIPDHIDLENRIIGTVYVSVN